jgi:hypothetical protein
LNLLREELQVLKTENSDLSKNLSYIEWKNVNTIQNTKECIKCESLLLTNSTLIGKLSKAASSAAKKRTISSDFHRNGGTLLRDKRDSGVVIAKPD